MSGLSLWLHLWKLRKKYRAILVESIMNVAYIEKYRKSELGENIDELRNLMAKEKGAEKPDIAEISKLNVRINRAKAVQDQIQRDRDVKENAENYLDEISKWIRSPYKKE